MYVVRASTDGQRTETRVPGTPTPFQHDVCICPVCERSDNSVHSCLYLDMVVSRIHLFGFEMLFAALTCMNRYSPTAACHALYTLCRVYAIK